MPQMSPMDWFFLSFYFLLIYYMFMILVYFMFLFFLKMNNLGLDSNKNYYMFIW